MIVTILPVFSHDGLDACTRTSFIANIYSVRARCSNANQDSSLETLRHLVSLVHAATQVFGQGNRMDSILS